MTRLYTGRGEEEQKRKNLGKKGGNGKILLRRYWATLRRALKSGCIADAA